MCKARGTKEMLGVVYLLQFNGTKLSDGHNNDKKGHKDDL